MDHDFYVLVVGYMTVLPGTELSNQYQWLVPFYCKKDSGSIIILTYELELSLSHCVGLVIPAS